MRQYRRRRVHAPTGCEHHRTVALGSLALPDSPPLIPLTGGRKQPVLHSCYSALRVDSVIVYTGSAHTTPYVSCCPRAYSLPHPAIPGTSPTVYRLRSSSSELLRPPGWPRHTSEVRRRPIAIGWQFSSTILKYNREAQPQGTYANALLESKDSPSSALSFPLKSSSSLPLLPPDAVCCVPSGAASGSRHSREL